MNIKDEITICGIKFQNRLVFPPMATYKTSEGLASDELVSYYKDKTSSKMIGLVILEHSYVSESGKCNKNQVSFVADENINVFKKIVDVIHQNGAKVIAQLNHAGSSTTKEVTGQDILGPSEIPSLKTKSCPKAMTKEDINQIIEDFKNAALRAKKAGFDGVEIHSAHTYLLNQFYSPLTNKRTDEYNGSSIEGRTRLHVEIIKELRKALGPDYLIALRLGAIDDLEGGTTIEDSAKAAKIFEDASINLLDISGGMCGYVRKNHTEEGYFSDVTEEIKKHISIPVILTGGIISLDSANKLLNENKADLIGIGRPIYKDSSWPINNLK